MTLKEFLALPPEEQAIEAAKSLTEKVIKPYYSTWQHKPANGMFGKCLKCNRFIGGDDIKTDLCPIPDPMKIDWNNAKRLQGECDKNQFEDAIEEVAVAMKEDLEWFEEWVDYLLHEITALHIITACMLAKNLLETG